MEYSKLFGCNIHKAIRISPIALKIVNTPEFQRMRNIKQLGLCDLVYPSATHTRFEHSLGVYFLAGKMVDKIIQQYPYRKYDIPEFGERITLSHKICECIKIAALCHDIGHGPYSHVFDNVLLKHINHPNSEHENRSCLIMEMLCKRELKDELNDKHIAFIKSIIHPQSHHSGALYQIVANHLNGIDADKFDYLARDMYNIGVNGFNSVRLIDEFIIDDNDNISYPKHCSLDIFEMFHTRYLMHKKIYCHKTVKLLECMLSDLFIIIDPIFKISDTIFNLDNFCKLTDNTIFSYLQTLIAIPPFLRHNLNLDDYAKITKAHDIYQNIVSRNLYQQIVEVTADGEIFLTEFVQHLLDKYPDLHKSDFEIIKYAIGFVSGNKPDPFNTIYFYNKKEVNHSFTLSKSCISGLLNDKIQEVHKHLVCKNRSLYHFIVAEYNSYIKK